MHLHYVLTRPITNTRLFLYKEREKKKLTKGTKKEKKRKEIKPNCS